MYNNLRPLTDAGQTLFPHRCYSSLYEVQAAPLCLLELEVMVRRYPIAWRETESGESELVALLGVARGHNMAIDWDEESEPALPLVLEAFPLALGSGEQYAERSILVEDSAAIAEGEGVPAFGPDGALSIFAERRIRAIQTFDADLFRARALSAALQAAGMLVPWELSFEFDDHQLQISGLRIVERDRRKWGPLREVTAQFGADAPILVTLHLISLFRMQALLDHYGRARSRPPIRAVGGEDP